MDRVWGVVVFIAKQRRSKARRCTQQTRSHFLSTLCRVVRRGIIAKLFFFFLSLVYVCSMSMEVEIHPPLPLVSSTPRSRFGPPSLVLKKKRKSYIVHRIKNCSSFLHSPTGYEKPEGNCTGNIHKILQIGCMCGAAGWLRNPTSLSPGHISSHF